MATEHGRTVTITVNGLDVEVRYDRHAIEDLLVPLLSAWIARTDDGDRHWAFLAAAPGTGKSTLLHLVQAAIGRSLQCVGMDGFHYPQRYLESTMIAGPDGRNEPLSRIKGAPETFDAEGLAARIEAARDADVAWPRYDRQLHDVVPDGEVISASHVLLEGNWLLLDDPRWAALRRHAEVTIFIRAPVEILEERLVNRKIQGGLSPEEARAFYRRSDGVNVTRALTGSDLTAVDLVLDMAPDGSLHESSDRPSPIE